MKKLMILLAAMAMSTLALQANEPAQPELTIISADAEAAVPAEGDKNETTKDEVTPKN
jgi:hypothetical protein